MVSIKPLRLVTWITGGALLYYRGALVKLFIQNKCGGKKPELSLQLLPEESNTCVREVEIRNVRYTTKYINVCAKTTKKKYTHFTTSKGSMRNKSNHKVSFCLL